MNHLFQEAQTTLRILTREEMDEHLETLQNTRIRIFGEDVVIPFDEVKKHRALGQDIYSAYGMFVHNEAPVIRAIVHGFMISHDSYRHIRAGRLDERELPAWKPSDGPGVLWIGSCLSLVQRGATRVIDDALRQIAAHPLRDQMDTIAAFATPKGMLLAKGMGLREDTTTHYKNGEPFFEYPLTAAGIENLASRTMNVFDCSVRQMYSV